MKIKLFLIILTFVLIAFNLSANAYAHGTKIEYDVATSLEIIAEFDSGEPMAEAQVTVYAPDAPTTPWITGFCDEEGKFSFQPDTSIPGTWDIQVRQAGHGDMIHIDIEGGSVIGGGSNDYSASQIVVMSACVIWGIIGTALFFKRRKTQ